MRKLGLCLFSCAALVAFMGFGAPAYGDHIRDAQCAPYNNQFGVYEFNLTTASNQAHAVSGLTGSGLACGTALHNNLLNCGPSGQTPPQGQESLNTRADINVPQGVQVNSTSSMSDDDFVGSAQVDVAHCYGLFSTIYEDQDSVIRVERDTAGTDCPQVFVACYKGSNPLGYNHNWVTQGGNGRYTMTIGPFHPAVGTAGITQIDEFNLCGNAGDASGTTYPDDCGDSTRPWLQKNGDRSAMECSNGNGIYTVTATNDIGQTTAPASDCVTWVQLGVIVRPSPIGHGFPESIGHEIGG